MAIFGVTLNDMLNFLKVPKNDFQDYYKAASFALCWQICLFFALVLGAITCLSFFSGDTFFPYYAAVMTLVIASLVYMKYTGRYREVAIVLFLGASVAAASAVFSVRNVTHTIEILWMVIIALAAFFILGRRWGYFFLLVNAIIYVIYFNTYFIENLKNINQVSRLQWGIMSVEFAFAMVLIGLIIKQYFKLNEYSIQKRNEAFNELTIEKGLVEQQNKEKTALLQEIHHRVKNNLQVIISLLRIHSQEMKSDEAKQSFQEAISRILTMSLIHQKMYEKEQLAQINLKDYLETLINDILRSSVTRGAIALELDIHVQEIGSKTVVPLALVINELVTNSIKHGVVEGGKIRLHISKIDVGTFQMHYSDSGVWKEPTGSSLGIQLIDIFTEQLDGSYSRVVESNRTFYQFEFKDLDRVKDKFNFEHSQNV